MNKNSTEIINNFVLSKIESSNYYRSIKQSFSKLNILNSIAFVFLLLSIVYLSVENLSNANYEFSLYKSLLPVTFVFFICTNTVINTNILLSKTLIKLNIPDEELAVLSTQIPEEDFSDFIDNLNHHNLRNWCAGISNKQFNKTKKTNTEEQIIIKQKLIKSLY